MTCDAFECRRDLEERCFIERAREELQGNRQLNWVRPFQTAAVRIAIVRHAIVDFSGESGGHDDGRKAGFGAEVDREARSGASVIVRIGLQHRLAWYEDRTAFEILRLAVRALPKPG